MAMIDVKKPHEVNTAAVSALGLVGGWLTARETGIRPLGGAVLAAAGVWAGRSWAAKTSPAITAGLSTLYVAGFGLSHPLAKKIGSWPAVLAVTGVVAGTSYVVADRG